jgi:hypothetical protein
VEQLKKRREKRRMAKAPTKAQFKVILENEIKNCGAVQFIEGLTD